MMPTPQASDSNQPPTESRKNLSFKLTKSKSKRSATLDLAKVTTSSDRQPRNNREYHQLQSTNAENFSSSKHANSKNVTNASNVAASAFSSLATSHAIPNVISLPRNAKASVIKTSKASKKRKSLIKKGVGLLPSKSDDVLFGIGLDEAILKDPSHDGVPLPAFLRYSFDYVEKYGLYLEGIYRVPGVKSQLHSLVAYLNRGIAFPNLPPTSATFLNKQYTNGSIGFPSQTHKSSKSFDGNKINYDSIYTKETNTSSLTKGQSYHRSSSMSCEKMPPHDPYVIACLIKYFFRSLPKDTFLSKALKDECEAACDIENRRQAMQKIGLLIHSNLARPQKYLLAWTLQNLMRIVNFSGNNLMNLQNVVTVMAPCLGFSYRLLEILLTPDHHDNKFIAITGWDNESENSSYESWQNHDPTASTIQVPHWLFPDKAFRYRPYIPPLLPMNFINDNKTLVLKSLSVDAFIEQVEETDEINHELSKQLSLLTWIQSTLAKDGKIDKIKENFLWEVQRIVTQMKRKKALLDLSDPELIRYEITRIQAQLDKLYETVALDKDPSITQRSSVSSLARQDSAGNKALDSESEIWCLQRTVTLLKRRLKYHERLTELAKDVENVSLMNADSTNDVKQNSSGNQPSLGCHILQPTPLENIDEEEILNLTLRKLPIEDMKSKIIEKSVRLNQQRILEKSSDSIILEEVEDVTPKTSTTIETLQTPLNPLVVDSHPPMIKTDLPVVPPRPRQTPPPQSTPTTPQWQPINNLNNGISSAFKPVLTSSIRPTTLCQDDSENRKLVKLESKFLELLTLNTDLKQRVHAEREEIDRIKLQIQELLRSGEKHTISYYANHLAMGKILRQSSCLKSLDRLTNTNDSAKLFDEKELQDWGLTHESIVNPYSQLINERAGEDDFIEKKVEDASGDISPTNENDVERNEDDQYLMMSMSEESDFDQNDDYEDDEEEDYFEQIDPHKIESVSKSSEGDKKVRRHVTDEYELAAQLHQLVKDNSELENLNGEYLKKIQEERIKCSEIKVLIKANQR